MNDNRQQTNIKNTPQRPYITNRKFLSNIQKFKGQNYKPKHKFQPRPIKRSTSTDNFNQYPKQPVKQEEKKPESKDDTNVKELIGTTVGIMDKKLTEFTAKVNSLIELKTKYYVDQRINVLENSNDLLTRGANELAIQADPTNAGNSFQFKYNGDAVARITDSGILYCRNLLVNGLNIITTLNSMMNTESSTAQSLSNYVKHQELKDGTYELNVKDTVTDTLDANTGTVDTLTSTDVTVDNDLMVNGISYLNTLYVTPDGNNVLEYPSRQYSNRGLFILNSGGRNIGYSFFCPLTGNGTYVYGLQIGKDLGTGNWGGIRWYHSNTNNNNNFISMSALDGYDTLRCKKDGTVYIRSPTANTNALWIQYEGNMSNNNYQRINIGDNRALATYAYGREGSTNYAYMKLNGKNCELRVYDTYMNVNGTGGHYIRSARTSGAIAYFIAASLANDNTCAIVVGQATSANSSGSFTYRRATTPLLGLGFYNNDELLTLDPSGNCNIRNSLTAGNAVLASTSVNDLYSAGNVTVDATIDCHKLNISDINKNTDYLHIIASGQTLSNNEYIRCRLSDSTGDGTIDLFHDTMYYGLKLQVPTDNADDNKLCIYPTGVTIDGQLDCYDDVNVWNDLEVSGTVTASTSITTPTITITTSGTVAGSNILTESRLWSSGNNYDVIPYTSSTGQTNCGSTINFWYNDTETSNPRTITYNGYRFEHNSPIGVTSTSSTLAQFYNDTVGAESYMKLGRNSSNSLNIAYTAASALASRHCTIGLSSYPAIDIYYDRVNIAYALTAPTLTASTSITSPSGTITNLTSTTASITNVDATNVYASNGVTVDGTVLMAMSDIADIADNKDYLKMRYEGTLADTHYIRMHMKDSTGNGYIDLVNNAGTYEMQLRCGTGQMSISNNGLSTDDVTISNTLSLGKTVNGICDSADVANQTNIDDDHLITAAGADALKANYTVTPPGAITNLTFDRTYVDWLAVINAEIRAITYGHGLYIALLDNASNSYCYSSDGIHWDEGYFNAAGDRRCICYGNGRFVTPVWNTTNINYSLDGINWYTRNCPTQRNWNACGYGNGMYIILSGSQTAIYSRDGMMWTEFNMGVPNNNYKWTSITYGNGVWVATIDNSTKIAYSTSGTSGWTLVDTNATYSSNWQSVAYGNGIFIAVGYIIAEYPSYIISTDGINWTEGSSDYSLDFASITYGNGWFVASSTWGELEWTKDGVSWSGTTYGSPNRFNSICAGPDKIVTLTTGKHLSGDLYVMAPYAVYTTTNFYPQPTYSTDLDALSQMIIGRIYPVGAIYTSMNPTNPSVLFGFGTWEMIEDQFLYCTPGPSGDHNSPGLNTLNGILGVTGSGLGGLQSGSNYYPARILCVEGSYTNTKASMKTLSEYGWDVNPPYLSVYAWRRTA